MITVRAKLNCGSNGAPSADVWGYEYVNVWVITNYPLVMTNSLLLKMAIYSEFSHEKWWFSIATLNYQRVHDQQDDIDITAKGIATNWGYFPKPWRQDRARPWSIIGGAQSWHDLLTHSITVYQALRGWTSTSESSNQSPGQGISRYQAWTSMLEIHWPKVTWWIMAHRGKQWLMMTTDDDYWWLAKYLLPLLVHPS